MEEKNWLQRWPILTHVLTLVLGFLLAILTGIGGYIAENIIIKTCPTMDVSVQEFKMPNYGLIHFSDGMNFSLKYRIKNKRFPNTWEKAIIKLDGQEVSSSGVFPPPIRFEPYETKEIERYFFIKGKEIHEGQRIEVYVQITDAFDKSASSKKVIIATK